MCIYNDQPLTASADIDVKWLKSNVVINTKKMAFKNTKQSWDVETDEYTLLICDCKPSDSGQYSVQASTDEDSLVHKFSITVVETGENPKIKIEKTEFTFIEEETFEIKILVSGKEAPFFISPDLKIFKFFYLLKLAILEVILMTNVI